MIVFSCQNQNFALSVRDYLKQNNIDCRVISSDNMFKVDIVNDVDEFLAHKYLEQLTKEKEEMMTKLNNSAWSQGSIDHGKSSASISINFNLRAFKGKITTVVISMLCIATWFFQLIFDSSSYRPVFENLCFNSELIKSGHEFWRIVTPAFLHFSLWHVAFNVVIFVVFASLVEKYLGKGKLILVFIAAAAIGNLGQYIANDFNGNFGGLSGVVNALIAYVTVVSRNIRTPRGFNSIPGMLPLVIIFVFINIIFNMGVANACHIIGICIGLIIGYIDYRAINKGTINFNK